MLRKIIVKLTLTICTFVFLLFWSPLSFSSLKCHLSLKEKAHYLVTGVPHQVLKDVKERVSSLKSEESFISQEIEKNHLTYLDIYKRIWGFEVDLNQERVLPVEVPVYKKIPARIPALVVFQVIEKVDSILSSSSSFAVEVGQKFLNRISTQYGVSIHYSQRTKESLLSDDVLFKSIEIFKEFESFPTHIPEDKRFEIFLKLKSISNIESSQVEDVHKDIISIYERQWGISISLENLQVKRVDIPEDRKIPNNIPLIAVFDIYKKVEQLKDDKNAFLHGTIERMLKSYEKSFGITIDRQSGKMGESFF